MEATKAEAQQKFQDFKAAQIAKGACSLCLGSKVENVLRWSDACGDVIDDVIDCRRCRGTGKAGR